MSDPVLGTRVHLRVVDSGTVASRAGLLVGKKGRRKKPAYISTRNGAKYWERMSYLSVPTEELEGVGLLWAGQRRPCGTVAT